MIENNINKEYNNSDNIDMEKFIKEVNELHAKLDSLTPYQLLNIETNTNGKELKKNYYRLVKRYHPDRYYGFKDNGFKEKLNDIFIAIAKSYEMIKSEGSNNEEEVKKQDNNTEAINQFKRGIKEYKEGNYWGAVEAFKWATRINPKKPKYWAYLSIALTKVPKRLKQAEEAILEAIKLDPFNSNYYVNLGDIYLKAGLKKRAKRQFEKALQLDPHNKKAIEGLKETK